MVKALFPLTLKEASVKRRGKTLAGPIDLALNRDGITIVMGPNGAGKTTLLRMMHGIDRLSTGSVTWAVPDTVARAQQAFVFQTPVILRRTVLENLAYPLHLIGMAKKEAEKRALQACADIGLSGHEGLRATRLSGGEKQKLALARALIRNPQVLFLDEPCANLDGPSTREIEALLNQAKLRDTGIIMSTHSIGQAQRLANTVIFMHKGALVEHSPSSVFFETPQTPQATAFLKGDILE
ncbi:ATP-binding cassette domain-containing protein [Halocynthiibacter namhaensis]|uniref:ATP-binding cassette domain-containing protein n=1 Tax=Halocynthiibacter namhaensis TaxID=1290553 RepID=UPI00057966EA|nr:ATP-binding cassette domain-containing protein [Halocynthiibacter namhaensis]